jgi:mannose-6-phosphate isomerase-like protein (cupin superfamily)
MQKVNLSEKLSQFTEHWKPKIAGELNGQQVKLVKFQGEFVWHHHDVEDELFLVVHGSFRMDYREGGEKRAIDLHEGEFLIVPRGVEHRPVADQEVHVLQSAQSHRRRFAGFFSGERLVYNAPEYANCTRCLADPRELESGARPKLFSYHAA